MAPISAEKIFNGLNSTSAQDRVNTLRLIRRHKDLAQNLCADNGKDLVGKLIELYGQFKNSSEKWEYVFTALLFDGDKTAALAKDIFVSHTGNQYMVMAANRLNRMTDAEKASFLPSILLADNHTNRSRLCANLLAENNRMDEKTALRVSVISDRKCITPDFNRQTADIWIREMQGPYRGSARIKFLDSKNMDVDLLLCRWETCDESLKVWILDKVPIHVSFGYGLMLKHILSNERSSKVLIAALQRILQHPCSEDLKPVIAVLLRHSDENVRMYGVRCHEGGGALKMMLAGEESPKVISEIILKCSDDYENIRFISGYFSHPHWKVRAASVKSLVDMAPGSIDEIKNQLFSPCNNARTCACRCLYELGMKDWVMENLVDG